jgi:hypothetical protein
LIKNIKIGFFVLLKNYMGKTNMMEREWVWLSAKKLWKTIAGPSKSGVSLAKVPASQ